MSGFERSAPVPGSQGPRRSEMKRINNAPPPLTPWRLEVLEAQRQAAEAMRKASGRSKSRSRSRSRDRHRDSGGTSGAGGSTSSGARGSRRKEDEAAAPVNKDKLLMQAKRGGEGWYAAVARAAEAWEEEERRRKMAPPKVHGSAGKEDKGKVKEKDKEREKDKEKDKRKEKERGSRSQSEVPSVPTVASQSSVGRSPEEEATLARKRKEELREKEEQERKWRAEHEARERRLAEDRKKAEEERKKKEHMEKQRKAKLGNVFAVEGDDDEEEEPTREAAKHVRKAAPPRPLPPEPLPVATVETTAVLPAPAMTSNGVPRVSGASSDLGKKLGFEGCHDPAEAFMRLQERKRKGRRAEFGGPPRGCSPWRDGKKGVTVERRE